jgi:hypothetical protein
MLDRIYFPRELVGPLCAPVIAVWPTLTDEQRRAVERILWAQLVGVGALPKKRPQLVQK